MHLFVLAQVIKSLVRIWLQRETRDRHCNIIWRRLKIIQGIIDPDGHKKWKFYHILMQVKKLLESLVSIWLQRERQEIDIVT